MNRQRASIGEPPEPSELEGPEYSFDVALFRVCDAEHPGPWFFARDGEGRFDLVLIDGEGTCYTAITEPGAVREVLGPDYRRGALIAVAFFEERRMWRLEPNRKTTAGPVADLRDAGWAAFQITNELWTMPDYELPQAWACCFRSAGFSGLAHGLRHLPGADGVSLFGAAGPTTDDERFDSFQSFEMDAEFRRQFSQLTNIGIEPTPAPTVGLNVIR